MPTAPKPLHIGRAATSEKRRLNSSQRGYTKRDWYVPTESFRTDQPLCERCLEFNRIEPMHAVDHIIPHRQNKALFQDAGNWQSLCKACHDLKTHWEGRGVIIFVTPRRREAIDVASFGFEYRTLPETVRPIE